MSLYPESYSSPGAWPWNSQSFEPGILATYETILGEEVRLEKYYLTLSAPPKSRPVHGLPAEIWVEICESLRQLDLNEFLRREQVNFDKDYDPIGETTNKNLPNRIITAHSICALSQACHYLHTVTSPFLLEQIRLAPPYFLPPDDLGYLNVISQTKCLRSNGTQRLQHVKGLAIEFQSHSHSMNSPNDGNWSQVNNLQEQIRLLLSQLPSLRHLMIAGIELDEPLMDSISNVASLEYLGLKRVKQGETAKIFFTREPRNLPVNLRSLHVRETYRSRSSPPAGERLRQWITRLIGPAIQDLALSIDAVILESLPVLPQLKFLEVRHGVGDRSHRGLLSLLTKTPNLKEAVLRVAQPPVDIAHTLPSLSYLERIVCHSSWLRYLVPGRSITSVKVICSSRVPGEELSQILCESEVPLYDLDVRYINMWPIEPWEPDDLEPIARYLPELETFRFRIQESKLASFHQAIFHVSRMSNLRLVSFGLPQSSRDILDDGWQELKLRDLLSRAKSRSLESIYFVGDGEWKREESALWKLWENGKEVRLVLL